MRQVFMIAVATMLTVTAASAQQHHEGAPAAIAGGYAPRLGDLMITQQIRHSKLWFAIAAAIAAAGTPSMKRGAARGVATLAVTSLLTNQVAKRVWKRPRPNWAPVPLVRRSRRMPTRRPANGSRDACSRR